MANEWMQNLPPELQAQLAQSMQSNDVVRPAGAQGMDYSKFSSPQALQSGGSGQQNIAQPLQSGLGSKTGIIGNGIGTGSGALGLGNGSTLGDLATAFGGGNLTGSQGLGALFSLIGL